MADVIVVVVAPGQQVQLHWQQPNCQPTITELLTAPPAIRGVPRGTQGPRPLIHLDDDV